MACSVASEERGALDAARALRANMPAVLARKYGDAEGIDLWERHRDLFEAARKEWGPRHVVLYGNDGLSSANGWEQFLRPAIREALADGSPTALSSVLRSACCDSAGFTVYKIDMFTDEFCNLLLEELDHLEASGIPLRRPNGMNRYGAILSQLGFQEGLLVPLMQRITKPFARMLWPEWIAAGDCDETYGFVVRYRIGEDVDLAEHADTSNVTLNVCLGRDFTGGDLYFKGCRFTDSAEDTEERLVSHQKGVAVLHLGGHFHGVRPITEGERSNLVLWATGRHGVVRIRPDSRERTCIAA